MRNNWWTVLQVLVWWGVSSKHVLQGLGLHESLVTRSRGYSPPRVTPPPTRGSLMDPLQGHLWTHQPIVVIGHWRPQEAEIWPLARPWPLHIQEITAQSRRYSGGNMGATQNGQPASLLHYRNSLESSGVEARYSWPGQKCWCGRSINWQFTSTPYYTVYCNAL